MASDPTENTEKFPRLGQLFLWVDKPGSANKIFWALAGLCVLLFLADFTYKPYGHFEVEKLPGFYGVYGFVMFTALIIAAKTLRILIKRPEDYYGDKAVDREEYPADQLEKVEHDV